MMREAATGAFEAVVFYDLDQFGCHTHQTMVALNALADLGVSVTSPLVARSGREVDLNSFEGRVTRRQPGQGGKLGPEVEHCIQLKPSQPSQLSSIPAKSADGVFYLLFSTADPAALEGLHDFLRFQITDLKTGDPLEVRERGN